MILITTIIITLVPKIGRQPKFIVTLTIENHKQ